MLKIGDFSRLSQIGIHALRNYDKIGLLQPSHVDKFTGYRYYTLQQLPCAHRIMALKEMGLSLEQIGIMLNQEISIEELRAMFRLKQAEIEQRVREDQKRLAMIEFHLHMINAEEKMPTLDVIVKDLTPFKALYNHIQRTSIEDTVQHHYEVIETLAKEKVQQMKPITTIMYGDEINADTEEYSQVIVVPVAEEFDGELQLPTQGTLEVTTIPAVKVVTTISEGGNRSEAFEKLMLLRRWAIENKYNVMNETRVIHLRGPMETAQQDEWMLEWQVVVEPQAEKA